MQSTCCLAYVLIFNRRRDEIIVLCLSILDAGGCVCVCMCVCTHTHTHTAHEMLDVRTRPENADTINVGKYVVIYVYKVHMYIYIL